MIEGNKQKIFFKLTEKGEALYWEHDKRHKAWEKRDANFLSRFPDQELDIILKFMYAYNEYLLEEINELEQMNKK